MPQEYCENAGGRLCKNEEIENGCTSFMGCSFDDSQVWSSTESDPIRCNDIVSYQACKQFVNEFDRLYDARDTSIFPEENPMGPIADELDFSTIKFPTGYDWKEDDHGIRSIMKSPDSYMYGYESILRADNKYCGDSILGPPSLLARACDDSMSFLLGNGVSLGLLTSTAKALNGKWDVM